MTTLTFLAPAASYGDLLTTTNNGQGLSGILEPLQDGFGNNSTVTISVNAINFNRQFGNTFELDGISLVSTATNINSVAQVNPVLPGLGGVVIPSGGTADRLFPPVIGALRLNTDTASLEIYMSNGWQSISGGSGSGDVVGPNSSIAGDIAIFSDTSGKLLADSGINIALVVPPLSELRAIADVIQLSGIGILAFESDTDPSGFGNIFVGTETIINLFVDNISLLRSTVFTDGVLLAPTTTSALVELSSTTGALLISRLTQTEINALDAFDGMMVYNTTTAHFNFRQNFAWIQTNSSSVTEVDTGTGLTGGPITSTGTISIANTAVTPGSYTNANITVNAQGQLTAANSGSAAGTVTSITAGTNLTGGTITTTGTIALNANVSGLTSISVGNISISANSISSTNLNGNVIITPNGSGELQSSKNINIQSGNTLKFYNPSNTFNVGFKGGSAISNTTWTLPIADGTSGQVLTTNGAANLSWTTVSGGGGGAPTTSTYILQTNDPLLPNSQNLESLGGGLLKSNVSGIVQIAIPDVDYATETTLVALAAEAAASAANASASATTAATAAGVATAASAASIAAAVDSTNQASNASTSATNAANSASAVAGVSSAKFIVQAVNAGLPNAQSLGLLTTGIVINTSSGGTGVLSIATAGVDYYAPGKPTTLIDTNATLRNLFVGTNAGSSITSGTQNTGVGLSSLNLVSVGSDNSSFGYQSLLNNIADRNTAFGSQSLRSNTNGTFNTAIGYQSLFNIATTNNNTAVGYQSLLASQAGDSTAVGYKAASALISGINNTAVGSQSLISVVSTNNNCAVGFMSLNLNTASNNTAVGTSASQNNISGTLNCAFGVNALLTNTSGSSNVVVGANSGDINLIYNQCVLIGSLADTSANNLTNAVAIGYNSSVAISNAMVLGNGCNVGIGTSSPANILHIVGTYQQKGITSGWTGTDIIKGQTSVQTIGAVTTTLLSIPIPTSIDTAVTVHADIVVILSTGASAAFANTDAGAWYNGATTASIGTLPTITLNTSALFAVTAVWAISGNNLQLNVTGIALDTINWSCRYQYHSVTTSIL